VYISSKRHRVLLCISAVRVSDSTPTITNLRKLHDFDSGSDLVDPTMYRQLIGSLIYMIHTKPDKCYAAQE
jgi:hypothetical protein